MSLAAMIGVVCALLSWPLAANAADMHGVSATEIRIGQTMPYSGPVSAFSALGSGGINERKINLISLDDGYAPPKSVEQTQICSPSDPQDV